MMSKRIWKSIVTLGTIAIAIGFWRILHASASPTEVWVEFEVELSANTPNDTICIAGNLPAVGAWNAAGNPNVALKRTGPTTARGSIRFAAGDRLEYKFTRGSWSTVEKDSLGRDIPNRTLTIGATALTVRVKVETWGDSAPPAPHTLSGDIRFHPDFASKVLRNKRTLAVYLPPGYETSRKRYPVLYMHDGQNIFDAATSFSGVEWGVDEACEKLIAAGTIKPMIVVGIYNNSSRVEEYTPVRGKIGGVPTNDTMGGGGYVYGRFIVEEVKPFIDAHYRTKPDRANTSIMGSSLGGLISLHLAWTMPKVFSSAGVVSPALCWADSEIIHRIEKSPVARPKPKLWIDMGTSEGDTLESFREGISNVRELASALMKKGFKPERDYHLEEVEGAVHNERAWNARIETILKYLFGVKPRQRFK